MVKKAMRAAKEPKAMRAANGPFLKAIGCLKVHELPAKPDGRRRYLKKLTAGDEFYLNTGEREQAGLQPSWALRAMHFSRPVGFVLCLVIDPSAVGSEPTSSHSTGVSGQAQFRWISDDCSSLELKHGLGKAGLGWTPVAK